jgi:hypothetical protein
MFLQLASFDTHTNTGLDNIDILGFRNDIKKSQLNRNQNVKFLFKIIVLVSAINSPWNKFFTKSYCLARNLVKVDLPTFVKGKFNFNLLENTLDQFNAF